MRRKLKIVDEHWNIWTSAYLRYMADFAM